MRPHSKRPLASLFRATRAAVFVIITLLPMTAAANLLTNPGAENGETGWTEEPATVNGEDNNWVAFNTAGLTDTVPEGTDVFGSAVSEPAGGTVFNLQQDVTGGSVQGGVEFTFSARVKTVNSDKARIIVEYRDGAGTVLESYDSGFVDEPGTTYATLTDIRVAPAGTSLVRVRLQGREDNNTGYTDAFFDAISLTASTPPLTAADDGAYEVEVPNNRTFPAPGLLDNDALGDPAGDIASFGGGDLGGSVTSHTAGSAVSLAGGTLTVNADGSFSLTDAPSEPGTYTFDYRLSNGSVQDDATVTIVVEPNNLLINPSAENGTTEDDTNGSNDVADWVEDPNQATGGKTNNWMPYENEGATDGSFAFTVETDTPASGSVFNLQQDVSGGSVTGLAELNVAADVKTLGTDEARIVVEYRDSSGNVLDSYDSGYITTGGTFTEVTDTRVVPAGTVTARVRLMGRESGDSGNWTDAFFDDVRLFASAAPLNTADDGPYTTYAFATLARVAPGLLANDSLGDPAGTITSFGGGDLGGAVTDNAAGATATLAGGTLTVGADGSFELDSPDSTGTYSFDYRLDNGSVQSDGTVTIDVQSATGNNLLLNPSAENTVIDDDDGSGNDPAEWSEVPEQLSTGDDNNWLSYSDFGSTDGANAFTTEPYEPGAGAEFNLQQDISGSNVQGGSIYAFSGDMKSASPDQVRILVEYRDGSSVLDSYDTGYQDTAGSFTTVSDTRSAPAGTTTIRVRLMVSEAGGSTSYADGAFDNLSLERQNAAPLLDLDTGATGNDHAATFSENDHQGDALPLGGGVAVTGPVLVEDPDGDPETITITLDNNQGDTGEQLYLDNGGLVGAVTGAGSGDSLTLVRHGASPAALADTLTNVRYQNDDDTPDQTDRTVTVVATDDLGATTSVTSTVTVEAGNDPPSITGPGGTLEPDEDIPFELSGANEIQIADVDAGGATVEVSLSASNGTLTLGSTTDLAFNSGGNGAGAFTVSGTVADLNNALATLDYQGNADYFGTDTISATVNDRGNTGTDPGDTGDASSEEGTATVSLDVQPVSDAPVFTASGPFTVSESAAGGTAVGDVDANDGDAGAPDAGVTYAITGGNGGGAFAIDNSGAIEVADASLIDFESSASFTLTVEADDGGRTTTATVTVNVDDEPPAQPADADGAADAVPEDAATGDTVGVDLEAGEPAGGAVSFALADDAGGRFAIDGNGEVTVADASLLDFEAATSHDIAIEARDADGTASPSLTVTISVTDVADGPTVVAPPDLTGADAVDATGLYTLVDLQRDGQATAADDGADLEPQPVDVAANARLRPGSHTITWSATDADGATGTDEQVVEIRPRVGLGPDRTVQEGTSLSLAIELNGAPIDGTTPSIGYRVAGTGTANASDYDGLGAPGTVTIPAGRTASLDFDALADGTADEGPETLVIELTGGPDVALAGRTRTTITIVEDNTPPQVSLDAAQGTIDPAVVIDGSSGAATVTVTASTVDATPTGGMTFAWDTGTGGPVDLDGSPDDAAFTFDPTGLAANTYTIRATATDGGSPAASGTATLRLRVRDSLTALGGGDTDGDGMPDNDPAEGRSDRDNDDLPDYRDPYPDRSTLQQSLGGDPGYRLETAPGLDLALGGVAFGRDRGGALLSAADITAELGASDPLPNVGGHFGFTVRGLPTPGASAAVVIPQRAAIPASPVYRKLDAAGDWVDFVRDANNTVASAPGAPGYCPPPDSGLYTSGLTTGHHCVRLLVEDGGPNDRDGAADGAILDPGGVAIGSNPPAITNTPPATVAEDADYSYQPAVEDPDAGDTATFSIAGRPEWASFDSATGALTGTPVNADVGTYEGITITATDGDGKTGAVGPFSIEVTPTNDAPTLTGSPGREVEEGSRYAFTPTAEDVDEGDSLTFSIASKPSWAAFDTATGRLSGRPERSDVGAYEGIVITVTDTAGARATLGPFSIRVRVEAEPPGDGGDDGDRDGDGLPDDFEAAVPGLDPDDPSDASGDLDGDGLSNLEEFELGTPVDEDSVPPVLTVPGPVERVATGLFTRIDFGEVRAEDALDGAVPVSRTPEREWFAPGAHRIEWRAADAAGNVATAVRRLVIEPLASLSGPDEVREGESFVLRIGLNGAAPSYPVTVPYRVQGRASAPADHDLTAGEVTIESGSSAVIPVTTVDDGVGGEGPETLTVTLTDPVGAGLAPEARHDVVIRETAVAPSLALAPRQAGEARTTVVVGDGRVRVEVLDEADAGGLIYDWSATDNALVDRAPADDVFAFDPTGLTPGLYRVAVAARRAGAGQPEAEAAVTLKVRATGPTLGEGDADGDGDSDADEGLADNDRDGIPAYRDPPTRGNSIPTRLQGDERFLAEGAPGVSLRLGETALSAGKAGIGVSPSELAAATPGYSPDIFDPVSGYYDFEARGLGESGTAATVVIPLTRAIPVDAVYRKLDARGRWREFDARGANALASAPGARGYCPPPGSASYEPELTPGHWCVALTIVDGGPNDRDGRANGAVSDPGGVTVAADDDGDPDDGGTDGDDGGGGAIGPWAILALFGLWTLARWAPRGRGVVRPGPS